MTTEALALAPAVEVEEYVDEENEAVRAGWRVDSVSSLDWALARKAALEAEMETNEALVSEAIDRLQARLNELNDQAMRGVRFFDQRINEYAQANKEELLGGGKKKSRKLPHGTVGWRKSPGGLEVVDEAALLAWAQAQPVELALTRVEEKPNLKVIKAYAEDHSTEEAAFIPPGTKVKEEVEKFYIEAEPVGLLKGGNNGGK